MHVPRAMADDSSVDSAVDASIEPAGSWSTSPVDHEPARFSTPWRDQLQRTLVARYVIIAAIATAAAVVAGGRGDWNVFVDAGRKMLGSEGFGVFVHQRDIQTGPLTLLFARLLAFTPRNGFIAQVAICGALGLACVRRIETSQSTHRRRDPIGTQTTTLIGGAIAMFWWAKLGGYGHLDDAIVLTAAVYAISTPRLRRLDVSAVGLGLAIGAKPWAVIFLPLLWRKCATRRDALKSSAIAAGVAGSVWLPFLIVQPDTIKSMRATVHVAADSVIALFGGNDANLPSWLRVAQLLGAVGVAALAMKRQHPGGVIVAAVACRIVTDPGTWSYYSAGIVIGALAWDICESRSIVPTMTICVSLLMVPSWMVGSAELRSWMRLVACAGAVIAVISKPPAATPVGRNRLRRVPSHA